VAPLGTPPEVVQRLGAELKAVLAEKDVQDRLLVAGAIAHFETSAELGARIGRDYAKWGKVIRENGIAME